MNNEEYFIIDTDCGTDDAFAIMLAVDFIQKNKIGNKKLLGITCCQGNTTVDKVVRNVALTLKIMQEKNVKLYKGSHCSLLKKYESYEYFGSDGLGNAASLYEPFQANHEKENGILALIDFVKMYPKRVTILCLGPLTNLAVAYLIDKQFFEFVKELYILGGNMNGLGNVTPAAEFNFYYDPEAVHTTLKNARCPVTIVPWEVCFYQSLPWDRYERMNSLEGDKALFFQRITKQLVEVLGKQKAKGLEMADLLLVAVYLIPNVVLESRQWKANIELNGELARGQLVVDKTSENVSGCKFVTKIDANNVYEMFEKVLL